MGSLLQQRREDEMKVEMIEVDMKHKLRVKPRIVDACSFYLPDGRIAAS